MPWDDKFECMPVEDLQKLQLEKLKETAAWAYEKIPFYQTAFDKLGIKPQDIHHLEDVSKLPVTV